MPFELRLGCTKINTILWRKET